MNGGANRGEALQSEAGLDFDEFSRVATAQFRFDTPSRRVGTAGSFIEDIKFKISGFVNCVDACWRLFKEITIQQSEII